jgi:hypothetical protein
MTRLQNPLEGTRYDPRYVDIAAQALKRGHGGDGVKVEVNLDNIGEVAHLNDADRERIAILVDDATGVVGVKDLP